MLKEALTNRDYPQIRGAVIMLAIFVCVVNLLVDLLYTYIDPRIRAEFAGNLKKKSKKKKAKVKGGVA